MSTKHTLCPVCEAGSLTLTVYSDTFDHHGALIVVEGLEGYVCAECGADPVFEDQIKRNHWRIVNAKRVADGLLTGQQIKELRKELALTQREASEVFGGGANAFSKYERGHVVQSSAMDKLLRLVGKFPYLLSELRGTEPLPVKSAANEPAGYVNGSRVRMSGMVHRSPVCDGRTTVVSIDEWKGNHAA